MSRAAIFSIGLTILILSSSPRVLGQHGSSASGKTNLQAHDPDGDGNSENDDDSGADTEGQDDRASQSSSTQKEGPKKTGAQLLYGSDDDPEGTSALTDVMKDVMGEDKEKKVAPLPAPLEAWGPQCRRYFMKVRQLCSSIDLTKIDQGQSVCDAWLLSVEQTIANMPAGTDPQMFDAAEEGCQAGFDAVLKRQTMWSESQ